MSIPSGYILLARSIRESDIAKASPCTREVWQWLLLQANHADSKSLYRGQCIRRIDEIREGLHWYVGYRKMMYSRKQTEGSLKVLRDKEMIVTTKVTHGMIITICNYDYYQDPKNYEGTNESLTKVPMKGKRRDSDGVNINKNGKNIRNNNENIIPAEKPAEVKSDFIDSIILEFTVSYLSYKKVDYEIITKGKERKAASKILNLHKQKNPEYTSEQTLKSLRQYFDSCNQIKDPWLSDNMSLSTIVSQFNKINNIIRNGISGHNERKSGGRIPATSDAELAGIFAKHYAVDYRE